MPKRCSSSSATARTTPGTTAQGNGVPPGAVLLRRRPHQVLRHGHVPLSRARLRGGRARGRRLAGLADPLCRARALVRAGRAPVRRARTGRRRSDRAAALRPLPVSADSARAADRTSLSQRIQRAAACKPFHMPAAIDFHPGGTCVRCGTCDAFPCKIDAKGDAETLPDRPGAASRQRHAADRKPGHAPAHRRHAASASSPSEVERGGESAAHSARACSCSRPARSTRAAMLLRSASAKHPDGLANSSGLVGRYYMNHNCTALMAVMPWRVNRHALSQDADAQRLLLRRQRQRHSRWAICNCSARSRSRCCAARCRTRRNVLRTSSRGTASTGTSCPKTWRMPTAACTLRPDGAIQLNWRRSNLRAHRRFVDVAKRLLKDVGFPIVLSQALRHRHALAPVRHGALRQRSRHIGARPATAGPGTTTTCTWSTRSFFPSSAALNPALTVAAQSLRAAQHIKVHLQEF